jgi:hypothetical protein
MVSSIMYILYILSTISADKSQKGSFWMTPPTSDTSRGSHSIKGRVLRDGIADVD